MTALDDKAMVALVDAATIYVPEGTEADAARTALLDAISALQSSLAASQEALRKYGMHLQGCPSWQRLYKAEQACTCGFDAASQPGIAAEGAGKTGGEQT